jgi:TolA-binding protein
MPPIDEILPANLLQALPVSAEDWAQTPKSVQALVIGLQSRLQAMEAEVTRLREKLNRNSGNSSQRRGRQENAGDRFQRYPEL